VGERILCRHPFNESKRAYVVPQQVEELLKCYWPGSSGGGFCEVKYFVYDITVEHDVLRICFFTNAYTCRDIIISTYGFPNFAIIWFVVKIRFEDSALYQTPHNINVCPQAELTSSIAISKMCFCFLKINQEKIYLLSRTLETAVSSSLSECVLIIWGGLTQHRTRWCFHLLWIVSSVILDSCNHGNVKLQCLAGECKRKTVWFHPFPMAQWGTCRGVAVRMGHQIRSSNDSNKAGGALNI